MIEAEPGSTSLHRASYRSPNLTFTLPSKKDSAALGWVFGLYHPRDNGTCQVRCNSLALDQSAALILELGVNCLV